MRKTEFELPEKMGGHLVQVEYTSDWQREDWGVDDRHHDYRWVLQEVEILSLSRYPESDQEGTDMIPFHPSPEVREYLESELFDYAKENDE